MTKILSQKYFNCLKINRFVKRPLAVQSDAWLRLTNQVKQCQACSLCQNRTQTVFGVGNHDARLMIIGEAPGFYEDKAGEPFVGRAGQLLNQMIKVLNCERQDLFIANILKCRPPNNRDPLPEEVNQCTPFLKEQINLVNPQVIVAVGRIAAHHLLDTKAGLESLRQKIHHYQNIPLVVTYHPAYLLRNPSDKKKSYQDLLFIKKQLVE